MTSGWLIVCAAVFLVSGCARAPHRPSVPFTQFSPAPMLPSPQIPVYHTVTKGQTLYGIAKSYGVSVDELMRANRIHDFRQLATGQRILIPGKKSAIPSMMAGPVSVDQARRIVGPRQNVYRWETITVHHSGTTQGSAAGFDKDHRRRRMGGLFYHFVIGNGTRTRDGVVETGFRWKKQIKANRPYDIQVCLVGNFDFQEVSPAQMSTTVNLIRALQETYGIPLSSVRQHCDIPGKHTDCPGKKFPFSRLLSELNR